MENETELIRDQMAETRTALTEKLDKLQEHVLGTVEGTTRTVTETVEAVQEAVQDTVGTVKESVQETVETVKSAFDLSEQMEKRPWLMMGGAVVVGYLGSRMLMGHDYTALPPPSNGSAAPCPPARTEAATAAVSSAASSAAGWLEELAAPLLKEAEGLALGVLAGVAADLIHNSAPEGMRGQLNEMVEKFASSVGTRPIRGLFAGDHAGQGQPGQGSQGGPSRSSPSSGKPNGFGSPSPAI
jgi:hypothetical protein